MNAATLAALATQAVLGATHPGAIPPRAEIIAQSLVWGVDPHLALAVSQVESGSVPERDSLRDRVVYKGNYGRFQIRCHTWKPVLGLARCEDLFDRHVNIRTGVMVLAYMQAHFGTRSGEPRWVGHYNEGNVVAEQGRRFASAVMAQLRRQRSESARVAGAFLGW
jgi:hypothetical protein